MSANAITLAASRVDRVTPEQPATASSISRSVWPPLVRSGRPPLDNHGGRVLTKEECKHPLWRACKRAGLRRIGWHTLHHTFASHLAMRGAPLKAVQELLGHATIQMTMRYAHLAPEVARDAVKLLDDRRGSGVAADAENRSNYAK